MNRRWFFSALACTVAILQLPAQEKTKNPEEGKSGTVIGVVTAKDATWIEVKADGEEKGRRYVPNWVGGAPAQGGGPDKAMLEEFKKLTIGTRIKLDWKFEERPRAVKVEVLKPAPNTDKK
jgi:hypothetical protein